MLSKDKNEFKGHYNFIETENEFEEYYTFMKTGLAAIDSHILFAFIYDCDKQYKEIVEYVNPILLQNKNKAEYNHNILRQSLSKIEHLEENMLAINECVNNFNCKEKYVDKIKLLIEYRYKTVSNLKETILKRKHYSKDELEICNLKFHRRYSYLVGILIVVQIILGVLSIDWNKKPNILLQGSGSDTGALSISSRAAP